jgi:hypothetical protein
MTAVMASVETGAPMSSQRLADDGAVGHAGHAEGVAGITAAVKAARRLDPWSDDRHRRW